MSTNVSYVSLQQGKKSTFWEQRIFLMVQIKCEMIKCSVLVHSEKHSFYSLVESQPILNVYYYWIY